MEKNSERLTARTKNTGEGKGASIGSVPINLIDAYMRSGKKRTESAVADYFGKQGFNLDLRNAIDIARYMESANKKEVGAKMEEFCAASPGLDIRDAAKIVKAGWPELFENLILRKNEGKRVGTEALDELVDTLCEHRYTPDMSKIEREKFRAEFKSEIISSNLEWFLPEDNEEENLYREAFSATCETLRAKHKDWGDIAIALAARRVLAGEEN